MAAHLHRIETDCLQVEMTATLSSLALIPPPATPLPPQILIRLKNINSRRASFLATLSFYIQVKPVLLDQIFSWCKSARFGWFHWNSKEAQTCLLASVTLFWSAQRVCSTALVVHAGHGSLTIFPLLGASETSDLLSLRLSQPRKEAARMIPPSLSPLCRPSEHGAAPRAHSNCVTAPLGLTTERQFGRKPLRLPLKIWYDSTLEFFRSYTLLRCSWDQDCQQWGMNQGIQLLNTGTLLLSELFQLCCIQV